MEIKISLIKRNMMIPRIFFIVRSVENIRWLNWTEPGWRMASRPGRHDGLESQDGMSLELGTLGSWWDVTKHFLLFISQHFSQIQTTDWVRFVSPRFFWQFCSPDSNCNPQHTLIMLLLHCVIKMLDFPSTCQKLSLSNGLWVIGRQNH